MQIVDFPGDGIVIIEARDNVIGGSTSAARNVIGGNGGNGVSIAGAGAENNVLRGNYIGVDASGTMTIPNRYNGVSISSAASSNTVGGTTIGERNVISGNQNGVWVEGTGTSNNAVVGNYIGTDLNGSVVLGNTFNGVGIWSGASSNRIGGSMSGEGNLISGNGADGIQINGIGSMGNTVSGNYIGTDVSGAQPLGNAADGVRMEQGASGNLIGGKVPGARNVVSGNNFSGVSMGPGTNANVVIGNFIGTDPSGMRAIGNGQTQCGPGVALYVGAFSNRIGGSTAADRNVVSGNNCGGIAIGGSSSHDNVVAGNYIGTDATGTGSLGNSLSGIFIYGGTSDNRIGGSASGERNVISGNGTGVWLQDTGTTGNAVVGNYIGTDRNGSAALKNNWDGVNLSSGASSNQIGGSLPGEGNVISGNNAQGIAIYGSDTTDNTISGNYIGLNAAGTAALGNGANGIYEGNAAGNTIGGLLPGERNVISANGGAGVALSGVETTGNHVSGNYFGTDANGTAPVGGQLFAAVIWSDASQNHIGPGNVVAYAAENGILVYGPNTAGNTITQNSIYSNAAPGIDDRNGGNTGLPAPAITQLTGDDTVAGAACSGCAIEVFSDDADEGQVYEGATVADSSGHFSFTKPGGFVRQNVTATATDADGNTSPFSASVPLAPLSVSMVVPNLGRSDIPNEINLYGSHFASGVTASLASEPPVSLPVRFIDSTHVLAIVPSGVLPGRYDLTVINPLGGNAALADAYEVYGTAGDDLVAYPYEVWTDPVTLRAHTPAGIALVVHRQGGSSALANVMVRFCRGAPDQGGEMIGEATIPILSPNSSVATPEVVWTPPETGAVDLYAVVDPDGVIPETTKVNNIISRRVTVLAAAADAIPPHVNSFSINHGAQLADRPGVVLDAPAADNAGGSGMASLLYVEFEYSQAAGQWYPVQTSGWVPYTVAKSSYPWKLLPVAGMKYVQAWAADRAGNISLAPRQTYINSVPSTDHVDKGQMRVFRYELSAGQAMTVTLAPSAGDPDLYVWPPDFPTRPAWVSDQASGADEVSFSAPVAGTYQIEVVGYTAADYSIVFATGATGSEGYARLAGADTSKPVRPAPALPLDSEPSAQIALPPPRLPQERIHLPLLLHS